jgi:hypothetical protein
VLLDAHRVLRCALCAARVLCACLSQLSLASLRCTHTADGTAIEYAEGLAAPIVAKSCAFAQAYTLEFHPVHPSPA